MLFFFFSNEFKNQMVDKIKMVLEGDKKVTYELITGTKYIYSSVVK